MARIRHPNVVPTIDVEATEGEVFVVMEYVHGESLSRLLKKQDHRPSLSIVLSVATQMLAGLHAACGIDAADGLDRNRAFAALLPVGAELVAPTVEDGYLLLSHAAGVQ